MNRPRVPSGVQLAERPDIQPLQGWGFGLAHTQGGASLTLGFVIEPRWGSSENHAGCRRMDARPPNNAMQGTPTPVSAACSGGNGVAFAEGPEMVEAAPLMTGRSGVNY